MSFSDLQMPWKLYMIAIPDATSPNQNCDTGKAPQISTKILIKYTTHTEAKGPFS